MTGKDFLKMTLCLYGYSNNLKVESYKAFGSTGYDIHAEDANGNSFNNFHAGGLMQHLNEILKYMENKNIGVNFDWVDVPLKDIIDDDLRNKIISARKISLSKNK